MRGKGKGGLPGFGALLFGGAGGNKFHDIHGPAGGNFKLLGVRFIKTFEILRFGFGRSDFGRIPTNDLGVGGSEKSLEAFFRFFRQNESGGGEGTQKGVGPDGVENGLVEAFSAEALGREKVGVEALKKFGIVGVVLLKEGVLLNGLDDFGGLRIDLRSIGGLDLEETNPSLKVQEIVLFGRGNSAGLESDFQQGLPLGRHEFV